VDILKNLFGRKDQPEKERPVEPVVAQAEEDVIISPDTLREDRLPPGQVRTLKWPVLHAGSVPKFNPAAWSFRIFGLVEEEWSCAYDEFLKLPTIKVKSYFHCVTR